MKSLSNERGVAFITELILAALVIGIIGYVFYTVGVAKTAKKSNPTATTATTKAVDDSCVATFHDADLCHFAAYSTSLDKQSYKATLNTTQAGQASTMVLQSDGKGNTSLSGTGNGATFNSIELAGATYVQGNGVWLKYPSGASAPTPSSPSSNMNIGVSAAGITYKKLGTEHCGNLTCFKYQVMVAATPNITQYVWFDNSSYKLHEWKYDDGSGNSTDMVVTYQAITISAPSPVQDFSAAVGQ